MDNTNKINEFLKKISVPVLLIKGTVYRSKKVDEKFNFIESAKKFQRESEKWRGWKNKVEMDDEQEGYSIRYVIFFEGEEIEIANLYIDNGEKIYREVLDTPMVAIDTRLPVNKRPLINKQVGWE